MRIWLDSRKILIYWYKLKTYNVEVFNFSIFRLWFKNATIKLGFEVQSCLFAFDSATFGVVLDPSRPFLGLKSGSKYLLKPKYVDYKLWFRQYIPIFLFSNWPYLDCFLLFEAIFGFVVSFKNNFGTHLTRLLTLIWYDFSFLVWNSYLLTLIWFFIFGIESIPFGHLVWNYSNKYDFSYLKSN